LIVIPYITIKDQFGIEIGGKLSDSVLESFAHITERQLSTLRMTCFGNAIRNRSVRQDTSDEDFFAS